MNQHWLSEEELNLLGEQKGYHDLEDTDPVRQYTSGWYIWNPEWSDVYGPFQDEFLCREFLAAQKFSQSKMKE